MKDTIFDNKKVIIAAPPKDYTGTAMTAKYITLKNADHLSIHINVGAWAAGTAAVSLLQATDVAATGAKALAFTKMWTDAAADGTLVETAVVASTFNIATAQANSQLIIEVDAEDLDTDNDFDCMTLVIGTPGANADLYGCLYLLGGLRYIEDVPPSALVD